MKISTFRRLGLATVTIATAISVPLAAFAYPPGAGLTASVSPDMVKASSNTTLTVTNGVANTNFRYRIGSGGSVTSKTTGDGSKSLNIKAPGNPGIYTVTVTQSSNSATAKLYVPRVTIPSSGRVNKTVTVYIANAKPGALYSVRVGSTTVASGTISGSYGASAVINVGSTTGSKQITVTVGSLSYAGSLKASR